MACHSSSLSTTTRTTTRTTTGSGKRKTRGRISVVSFVVLVGRLPPKLDGLYNVRTQRLVANLRHASNCVEESLLVEHTEARSVLSVTLEMARPKKRK